MTEKEIKTIQEFMISTPGWVEQLKGFDNQQCLNCGCIPRRFIDLRNALLKLFNEHKIEL